MSFHRYPRRQVTVSGALKPRSLIDTTGGRANQDSSYLMLNIEGKGRNVSTPTSIQEQKGERQKTVFVFTSDEGR